MVRINLKGIAKVTAKGRTYWYAWRGGPRLRGKPGRRIHRSLPRGTREPANARYNPLPVIGGAVQGEQRLREARGLNQAQLGAWLDRIARALRRSPHRAVRSPGENPTGYPAWRNQWADKPRAADYGMQVLSRVLSHAVDPLGKIAGNPCEGIKQLYSATALRSSGLMPTSPSSRRRCSAEIAYAVDLAAHTGLRLGDLLRLSWSHVGEDAICITTGKSRHRREAIIPLYDALEGLLASIPKRSTTILTNSRRRPGQRTASALVQPGEDRRRHRTTAICISTIYEAPPRRRFYIAGLSERVIAEIMAWEEEHVARLSVAMSTGSAATKEIIRQLNEPKERT